MRRLIVTVTIALASLVVLGATAAQGAPKAAAVATVKPAAASDVAALQTSVALLQQQVRSLSTAVAGMSTSGSRPVDYGPRVSTLERQVGTSSFNIKAFSNLWDELHTLSASVSDISGSVAALNQKVTPFLGTSLDTRVSRLESCTRSIASNWRSTSAPYGC